MTTLIVARGTIVESLRDRVLYLPIIFVVFLLVGSIFLGSLSLGEMDRLVTDFGLAGITFFSLLSAVFLGIGWSYQSITRRTAYALLARPISRRSILWGAYIGLGLVQLFGLLLMSVSWWFILRIVNVAWTPVLSLGLMLLFTEVLLVTALCFLLTTFISPAVAGATSVVLLLVGYATRGAKDLVTQFPEGAFRWATEAAYFVLPCLSNFSASEFGYPSASVASTDWLWSVAYGLSYTVALLALAAAVFTRRELY